MSGAELKAKIARGEDIVILDVRDEKDRDGGRIAGSLNIVLEDLMARYQEIPMGKEIVIVDLNGKQATITGRYLVKQGYSALARLEGGVNTGWIAAGYPVEK